MTSLVLEAVLVAVAVWDFWGIGPKLGDRLISRHRQCRLERCPRAHRAQAAGCELHRLRRAPLKQRIACTRSFGQPIRGLPPLGEAVTTFASRAAEKLRGQQGHAGKVLVFTHRVPCRPFFVGSGCCRRETRNDASRGRAGTRSADR